MGQPFGVNHDLLVALQARTLGADDIAIRFSPWVMPLSIL
ncbi:hypothetical protein AU15_09840 [Marinobacter salarius]|uniref:Uncharacterized protein n=1 Tax=Marinobacter salarius TaxID=1420917 RepID=W5YVJ2_9GAMM|nr:hypothetical protein AU15_09840 [Marinobacter salarius]